MQIHCFSDPSSDGQVTWGYFRAYANFKPTLNYPSQLRLHYSCQQVSNRPEMSSGHSLCM